MQPGHLNPARLPLGTRVGPWRVVERRGLGTYGAIYRAIGAELSHGPVALKLALHPGNARFAREAQLLSRIRHPCVPRLVDHGAWRQPSGLCYPYLAMELIDGLPLYDWAREHQPTSRQVLRLLADLARALEATHAAGGVHRDVKGDNVLMREADGRAFLTDFGSGHYLGAAPLTEPPFPPGTPPYRSPEAWRSVRLPLREHALPYAPSASDDVFALGVTAYRLVTGEYPFTTASADGLSHPGQQEGPGPLPARAVNVRCCAELSALVSRMLSIRPEARGSARELAEALEQATRAAGPEADVSLFVQEAPWPMDARAAPRHVLHRAPGRSSRSWLAAVSLGGALAALGAGWMLSAHPSEEPSRGLASVPEDARDGGSVAVGDSALTAPVSPTQAPSAWSTIALEMPPRPFPGQIRPEANGRCPGKVQVPINGGCWIMIAATPKDCDTDAYVYKGACYVPVFPPARPSTSNPTGR